MIEKRLQVENLSAGYGREQIVRDISFTLPEGVLCSVVGQNGSGKTTLLRAVCGLLPYSGRCRVDGEETADMSVRARAFSIGYLSQDSETMKGITCMDMVLLGYYAQLGAFKTPGTAQKRRAENLMEELGVAELAKKEFASASTGQRQLVRIARTLVAEPKLLVLDEADAALDLQHRKEVFSMLGKCAKNGCTVLNVSHDINAVLGYSDRLLILQNGKLIDDVPCRQENTDKIQKDFVRLYGSVEVFSRGGHLMMGEII